ncbi:MAG: hypothetical protein R3F14_23985 [Polyangiaceae bacterium]
MMEPAKGLSPLGETARRGRLSILGGSLRGEEAPPEPSAPVPESKPAKSTDKGVRDSLYRRFKKG